MTKGQPLGCSSPVCRIEDKRRQSDGAGGAHLEDANAGWELAFHQCGGPGREVNALSYRD